MNIWVFPKIMVPPNHFLNRVSIINHPFWGTTIFGNTHISTTKHVPPYKSRGQPFRKQLSNLVPRYLHQFQSSMRSIKPLLAVSLERASDEFRSTFFFMGIFSERRWKIQTYPNRHNIKLTFKLNSLWKHVGRCRQCSFTPKICQTCWCDRPWKDRKKKSSFPFRGPNRCLSYGLLLVFWRCNFEIL